ncbi:MAG: ornithine cyclodeaminase family protein [Clostridia bacterium]|nr:ornithine cyclodeaminase family protein [Clostridia bacterium]
MSFDIIFLNNKEMEELGAGNMAEVMNDVETAYRLYAADDVLVPGKLVMPFGKNPEDEYTNGRINCMPGYIGGEYAMAGVKWIGSAPDNYTRGLPRATSTIILNDPVTKMPVGVCEGTQVSAMRTGASGGVAMKYLAPFKAEVICICGAGVQGRTQLEAALLVRPTIKKAYVYDLYLDRAEAFAKEMGAKFPQIEVIPVPYEQLGEAVGESDIVDTATLAQEPFVKAEWIKKGALIVNMSAYEVEKGCVSMASKVVVDFWETVKHRLHSTVAHMADEGTFRDEDLYAEIGEIVDGKKVGRENDEETIYFNAVGTGILDLAVAARCYHNAKAQNKGTKVPFWV